MPLTVVIGAPCSGKSTFVRESRQPGDVVVDFDALASALGSDSPHDAPDAIRDVAFSARDAAISRVIEREHPAFVIHTNPSGEQVDAYEAAGASFVVLDPGKAECVERAKTDGRPERAFDAIERWYDSPPKIPNQEKGAPMLRFKDFSAEPSEDGGGIVAYAATFDREPDSYGDVIARGAFAKSLERWAASGKPIPLLYGHDMGDPDYNIGTVTSAVEDERGLRVEASFDDSPKAQRVRELVRDGRLSKMSFAYNVKSRQTATLADGREVNELLELDIYEISVVLVPANQHAEIVEAKSGRRNSRADEEALRGLLESLRGAMSAVTELIGDSADEGENEEEPQDAANSEDAKSRDLIERLRAVATA